ncbi:ABC transporter substrate-binding protein [Propionibacterium australiense]|uniref:ABC transporter substrate-binding protein n=1 Tax=Propionibacterium australiense TaxID=119981 RepID=A0A383S398_9ACTN|nr:ABC transporter substrate-binding protein [Propionibacterium australiense]RLP11682.1 ABC transporter substrate-binding protein [Propionibacterium australiense]RLP12195.1 ABC transporter substrate-binding protein [Propionibacterium australiense]SYZ32417.1 Solute-binding protein family 5 domain [Propionibacterium australiense]VEH90251.1 Nickel-binding periplasmic protein precursor [Propionibacterium australiense]
MKTSRRTLLGAVGLAGLSATALTGCFSDNGSSGSAKTPGTERLKIASLSAPKASLSPFSDDAYRLFRWSAIECLTILDDEGKPQPSLATGWEQRSDTEWVFTLRDGVTFHDGTAFDAETAVNSLAKVMAASPLPRVLAGVQLTASAEDGKLVITTAAPDPLLPNRVSSPNLCMLAPSAYGAETVDPIGHGSGAFVVTKLNGTANASLDRYEGYWGDRPLLAGIEDTFVPDGTSRASALRTGEADIAEALPIGQLDEIEEGLVHEIPNSRTTALYLNTSSGVFTDPAVRAAAREAVDTKQIVEKVFEGHADPAAEMLSDALNWPAEARKRVGFENLLSSRAKASSDLNGKSIKLATYTDRPELPEIATQLEQAFKAAGFTVEQTVREYTYLSEEILSGAFDAVILSRSMTIDSGDPVSTLASDFTSSGSFNIAMLKDPEVDSLVSRAGAIEPGQDRQDAVIRAEAAILALDAVIPLVHERTLQGEASGVSDAARDNLERRLVTTKTDVTR